MVRLLSLFSGIGAFEKALTNLEIPFELIAYCEFDKYASKAYSVIHDVPESMNLGDITKVDEKKLPVNEVDILTYGFPCQPFSMAGKQEGFDDCKGRGSLFFDALRIIKHCKPKIAIAENVKNIASKKFEKEFQTVLQSLEEAGYNNYWKILDVKDYDLAQHRERVIIVSIRKDLDSGVFEFPDPVKLKKCLNDYLEKDVDERYYIPDEKAKQLIPQLKDKLILNTIRVGGRGSIDSCHQWDLVVVRSGIIDNTMRCRKVTPLECFRLMGFTDEDFEKVKTALNETFYKGKDRSNSQLYKLAGNSISVPMLEYLFRQMLTDHVIADIEFVCCCSKI